VGGAEHSLAADNVRVAGGVGSGTATQSQELSSGWTVVNPELGLFLRRDDVEVALGYGDFLRGLEERKALPLKERRRRLKNEVIKVSVATTLS